MRNSGRILLESAPTGINLDDIRHDLELVSCSPGILVLELELTKSRSRVFDPSMSYMFGA